MTIMASRLGKYLLLPLAIATVSTIERVHIAFAQSVLPATDGTGTIVTPNGSRFDIGGGTQAGGNLFHSFQQFGLNPEQTANFLATPELQNILSRVVGGSPSVIDGLIQVTGGNPNLYLLNPAGIVFGQNASLNIPASFTASTATGIGFGTDQWFQAIGTNNYASLIGTPTGFQFDTPQPGSIINAGFLAVNHGQSLTLLGGTVVNTGALAAPNGSITVLAVPGSSLVRLSQLGSLLSLEIAGWSTENGGQPQTALFPFSPTSLPALLTGSGLTSQATGLSVEADGTVRLVNSGALVPASPGTAIVTGELSVANLTDSPSMPTSQVAVLGDRVGLFSATIDASHSNHGGTVRIGGDYKGQGAVPNAQFTVVDAASTIRVDATSRGNGGRAIIWADNTTRFSGTITARGGALGGDGGFVEVSGKNSLLFTGFTDTSAPLGRVGTLLLDPTDIYIGDGGAFSSPGNMANNNPFIWGAGFGDPLEDPGGQATGTNSIYNLLLSNSVILEATNDIGWDGNLNFNGIGTGKTLELRAGRNISFSAGRTIQDSAPGGDSLNIIFHADFDNDNNGSLIIDAAAINTQGGSITFRAGSGVWVRSGVPIDSGGGVIMIVGSTTNGDNRGIIIDGNITSSGGDISLTGTNTGTGIGGQGIWINNGTIASAGGNITFTGSHASGGRGIEIQGGGVRVSSGTGNISFNGSSVGPFNFSEPAGIHIAGGVSSTTGTIQFTGTGTDAWGIHLAGGNLSTAGGAIQLTGNSVNRSGLYVRNGSIESNGGHITLQGSSASGGLVPSTTIGFSGVDIGEAFGLVRSSGGTITIQGVNTATAPMAEGIGTRIRGRVDSGSGDIVISGSSGTARGVGVYGIVESTGGNITLIGNSTGSAPLAKGTEIEFGTITTTGTGAISITGNSTNRHGVNIEGSFLTTGSGNVQVFGSTNNRQFSGVNGGAFVTTNGGNVTVVGTNTAIVGTSGGSGVTLQNAWLTNGGNVTITGSHNGNEAGIRLQPTALIESGTGNASLTGSSQGGIGVWLRAGSRVSTTTGAIALDGITGGGGQSGIALEGSVDSDGGDITATGRNTALTGSGGYGMTVRSGIESRGGNISLTGNHAGNGEGLQILNNVTSSTGTGNITLSGTSNSQTGVFNQATIRTTGGVITITGNTTNGDSDGVNTIGIVNAEGGNITIVGNNTGAAGGGQGVSVAGTVEKANISITGNHAGNGEGVELNATFANTGNLTVSGTTNGGAGVWIRSGTFTSTTGAIQVTGTTNNGNNRGVVSTIPITSSGGDITLVGTNTGATGTDGQGIWLTFGSGGINSNGGDISLTGITPNNVNIPGIQNIADIVAGAGDITLTADRTILQSSISGTGALIVQPYSIATNMVVGTGGPALSTFLNNFEIANLNFGNYQSITIGRADSTGLLTIPENRTIPDDLILRSPGVGSAGIALNGSLNMTGNNLTINSGGPVTQTAPILNTNGLELLGSGEFVLTNANNAIAVLAGNMTGNATYRDVDGFLIGTVNSTVGFTTTGNLVLNSPTAVTQSQAVIANGLGFLGTGFYDLTLGTNDVNILAANTDNFVRFRDADDLTIGTVSTAVATVTGIATTNDEVRLQTGGDLTINRTINVGTANVILNVGGNGTQGAFGNILATGLELLGAGSFTLTNPTNNVTILAGNTTGAISYVDADALDIRFINASSGVTTDNSPIAIATVNGPLTIFNEGGAADDVSAGDSTVSLTAGGANQLLTIAGGAEVVGTGGVTLAADNIALNGTVDAGTNIATLRQFTNGQLINLGGADAIGTLGLTDAELDQVTAGVIRVGNANSGVITVTTAINPANSGTLSLQTGTTISQVAGATLTVGNLALRAVGDVMLTNTNDVTELAANTTGNIAFTATNALNIGTVDSLSGITTTGHLALATGGMLTDSAPLTIVGTTTLATGANDIVLDTAANDFSTIVILSTGNATFVDANALDIGNATVAGNLTITTNGNLTDSGNLVVAGITSLNTTGGNVVLDSANNDLATVTIANTTNATLVDRNALSLGNISLTGNLTITTGGLLAQTVGTSITVPGTASFTTTHLAGNVTVRDSDDTVLGNSVIGGDFTLTSAGNISQAPGTTLKVAGNITPNTAGSVTLANPDNVLPTLVLPNGDVVINQVGTVNLPARTVTGNLTVISKATGEQFAGVIGGDAIILDNAGNSFGQLNFNTATAGLSVVTGTPEIIQSGIQTVAGTTTLNATAGGNITLNLANQFNGDVAIAAGNNVTITNAPNLALGNSIVSGNLTVQVTAGNLVDNGTLTVAGTTTLATGANNIVLDTPTNDFTTIVITNAGNVTLVDTNTLNLGNANVAGNLTITTNGDLTDSGNLVVAGTMDVDTTGGNILLDSVNNDLATVTIANTTNATLVDSNALSLGNTVVTGNLTVTTGGDLTSSGAVVVGNTASFTAGANTITLNNANNFNTVAIVAGNATINDINALNLGDTTITGNLTVTTAGDLTDSGTIVVGNTASLNAGTSTITLNNANDFNTVAITNASDVTLNDINALTFGNVTLTGNLTVAAGGLIAQAGGTALLVPGNASFTTTLVNAGTVRLTNTAASGTKFGDSQIGGNLVLNSTGAGNVNSIAGSLLVTGTGSITSNGTILVPDGDDAFGNGVSSVSAAGDVVISGVGAVVVNVTTPIAGNLTVNSYAQGKTFIAGTVYSADAIVLNNASNAFGGTLRFNTFFDGVTGDITATPSITQTAPITMTDPGKTASFNAVQSATDNTPAGIITLTDPANQLGAIALRGTDVALQEAAATVLDSATVTGNLAITSADTISLGNITVNGNFAVTSNGAITNTGNLAIGGTATLAAGIANDITLDNTNNNFGTVVISSGNNVTLTDQDGLTLATSTVSGNLTVTSGNTLTQAGTLTVTGATSLNAGSNDVIANTITSGNLTIVGQAVSLNGAITTTTGNFTLTNSGLATISAGSDFTLAGAFLQNGVGNVYTAGNITNAASITFTQATTLTGNVTLTTSDGAITFANTVNGNAALSLNAGAGNITIAGAVGNSQALGDLQANSTGVTRFNADVQASSLSTNAGGITELNGNVTTTGNQTYGDAVRIDSNITLAGNTLNFNSTVNSQVGETNSLTLVANSGGVNFATQVGDQDALDNLTITTNTNLTQGDAWRVLGTMAIAANTHDITLTNAGNDFNLVNILSGNNVRLQDSNNVSLGTFATILPGNLTIQAGGEIVTTNAITTLGNQTYTGSTFTIESPLTGNTITLNNSGLVSGTGTLTAATLTLNGTGNLGTSASRVNLAADTIALNTTATDLFLNQTGATALQGMTAGNLNLLSNGNITQGSAAIVVGGTTTLATGTGNITLTNATNDFTTVTIASANSVTLADQSAITFGNVTVSSDFGITAGGLISQAASTRFVIPGNASFTTTHGAGNVTITNSSSSTLGNTVIGGDFTLTSTGNITQAPSTVLQVAGGITLNTTASTVLSSTGNILPDITLPNGDVIITRVGIIDLPTRTVTGSLSVNSQATGEQFNGVIGGDAIVLDQAANSFSGSLSLNTTNAGTTTLPSATPGITQSGVLTVAGTTALNATSAGNITLNLANNLNTVQVTGGNNVVVNNTAGLSLGTSTIAGDATFTANGAITDIGNLTIGGITTLDVGTNDVTLTNAHNFNTVAIVAGNATINDINALNLGNTTITGNLTITTGGNLIGSGDLVIGGTTSFDAGNNTITMANANDFNTLAIVAGNATINDINDLELDRTTVTGNLTVTTRGNITQRDDLTIGDIASFNAGNGDITLSNPDNQFNRLQLEGNNADIQVNADLALGNSTLVGSLTVTALTGNLTVTGNVTANDDILLTANGITLNAALAGSGNLTLQPLDSTLDVGIGAITGGFDLSTASLDNLVDGFTQITIGQVTGTGTIVLSDVRFADPVLIPSGRVLVGADVNTTWAITGANSGHLDSIFPNGLRFINIGNLTGGSGDDVFVFADGATVSGIVDGGAGVDRLDYSAYTTPVTVNLAANTATGTGGIRNIEGLTGGQSNNTLVGANIPNTWRLIGQNQGTVGTFTYENVQNLVGGSEDDVFVFANGARVTGLIDGGAGVDTLDYSAYTTPVEVNLAAGTATGTGGIRNIEQAITPPKSQPQGEDAPALTICSTIASPDDPLSGQMSLIYCANDSLATPELATTGDPTLQMQSSETTSPPAQLSVPQLSPNEAPKSQLPVSQLSPNNLPTASTP